MTFLPGAPQNVTIGVNETLQAVAAAIPIDVAFVTLQFHTQDHNATLSYTRVSSLLQSSQNRADGGRRRPMAADRFISKSEFCFF